MAFTVKDVQALREMTGAGMMDCKKALTETDGDIEKAVAFLREKGMAAAAKKAGRVAAEGLVSAFVGQDGIGAMVEVNSETDFAAKSDVFIDFVKGIAQAVAQNGPADLDALGACKYPGSEQTVAEALKEKVFTIGENLQIRRFVRYESGRNVAYVHMGGKIGVLVSLDVSDSLSGNTDVTELGKDVAMQIAAMRPLWLDRSQADETAINAEKEIYLAQAKAEGKPDAVAEKMVVGRVNKYFQEVCLLDQPFVKENKMSVGQYVAQRAKEWGGTIAVTRFDRFEKGEGLAKREDNFADEVAQMVK